MKIKNICIYTILICLLFIAASCSSSQSVSPEDVLKSYISAINNRDYEKMYSMISQDSDISKDDFVKRNKNIYEGIDAENVTIEIEDANKDNTISYKTTMDTQAGQISFENKVTFEKENGENKIKWSSNLIFPNLNSSDTVRVKTTAGVRGNIYDRNGNLLAGESNMYSVGFVPGKMNEATKDEDIKKVAEILDMSADTINSKLSESWVQDNLFVPLKNISYTDTDTKNALLQIKGISLSIVKRRVYPLGEKAAHLTGYIGSITQDELDAHKGEGYTSSSKIGKIGLESLYEDQLRSIDGCKIYITDKDNKEKEVLVERKVQNGKDITLTIDINLQIKLYDQMKNDKGAAVVMNPNTGEILALVSTPSYDPNDFILGMSSEKWAQYNNKDTQPMLNRFKQAYAPGSALKPITASIGLSSNSFRATDDFGASGTSWQKDSSWGSYTITTLKQYSGAANVKNALINSDNIYFAKAALKIGSSEFAKGLKNLGFGEDVPFEFGLTDSVFGTNLAFSDDIDLADSGYGQGKVLVNPVHLASIYTAFVNDGNMMTPYLDKSKSPTVWKENVFPTDTINTVKDAMVQVIEDANGTGHSFKINGLKIAGKTGTAEIKASKGDTTGTELGWFVAFPADKSQSKQYLVVAMIEDVKDRGGSHYVIPIVRSIFTN